MCKLDLQRTLARACAAAEDLQNEAGAVEHFRAPGFFEIALLHRRKRAIHYDDADVIALDQTRDLLDFSLADECCRPDAAERSNAGGDYVEFDGASKPDCF